MAVNLVIDGNYILYKNIHSLHSQKILFGELHRALNINLKRLFAKYPWSKIHLVSDSRIPSWRKEFLKDYKGKRIKDDEIDWEFCFNTYDEVKDELRANPRIIIYEKDGVEGDDWIREIVELNNNKNQSNVVVASDADLQQLLDYRLNPKQWINIQWRENYTKEKIFFPLGHKLFIENIKESKADVFSLNDNDELLKMINIWLDRSTCEEIDGETLLFVKILDGDVGDNISSVYVKESASGRRMGIGAKTALKIYSAYKELYPDQIVFEDNQWKLNVIPIIEQYKKLELSKKESKLLLSNLENNTKIIHLNKIHLPKPILEKINTMF